MLCEVLSSFQRFRLGKEKFFSQENSEILGKKFKATISVVFHIKINANIWKKQLAK